MILEILKPFLNTDIYLFDQILRGRIQPGMSVLDYGCGNGRNIPILSDIGCKVTGIDMNLQAIEHCNKNFQGAKFIQVDFNSYIPKITYDFVIANAIFHFAEDEMSFKTWANNAWNSLKSGGILFSRLSTKIALPHGVSPPGFTYLATEDDLISLEQSWNADRIDPLKTTLVEKARTSYAALFKLKNS